MQCVDEPALAFVVADPAQMFTDYEFDIPDSEVEKLKLQTESDALVMVILTVGTGGKEITANLAAPMVVNMNEMLALQLILQDSRYQVRQPLVQSAPQQATQPAENSEQELLKVA
jgi:flagellar assembly factor FliW